MVIAKDLLKLMDQICSLMETTMRQSAGESGLPMGLPRHCRMHFWPRANVLHIQSRLEEIRNIFDDNLSGDIDVYGRLGL